MQGHTKSSVDRYFEPTGKPQSSLQPVATPNPEDDVNPGVLKEEAANIESVLRCTVQQSASVIVSERTCTRGCEMDGELRQTPSQADVLYAFYVSPLDAVGKKQMGKNVKSVLA